MDTAKYNLIKKAYEDYYNSFLKQGRLPLGSTSMGFWGAAIDEELVEIFKRINIKNYKNFLDLGSGDGKVVIIASLFGINASGVEHDRDLFRKSIEMREKLGINCKFYNKDYFDFDVSPFDLVFINPDKPFERGLERKLISELKGKLIVYGSQFRPKSLALEESFFVELTEAGLYSNNIEKNAP